MIIFIMKKIYQSLKEIDGLNYLINIRSLEKSYLRRLFIRINNTLKEKEYLASSNAIKELVSQIGIKYLVINFNEESVDNDFKLKLIINNYEYLKKISGKLLLCGNIDISLCNNLYIDKIDNELEAFKIIDRRQNGLN